MLSALNIMVVIGARPNYMKAAPLLAALRDLPKNGGNTPALDVCVVHTGQHYEDALSKDLLQDIGFPPIDDYLNVGSGSHAAQTAEIIKRFEPVIEARKPDVLVVFGDVNSTLACALVAAKSYRRGHDGSFRRPRIVHVEAGLRSFDLTMPEEINRRLTDVLADDLLTHSPEARDNLIKEGVDENAIHYVGNLMIDTLDRLLARARQSTICERLGLCAQGLVHPYAVLTLHRPSNVDDDATFERLLRAVLSVSPELDIVYPLHPRVRDRVQKIVQQAEGSLGSPHARMILTEPLTYLEFIGLMDRARVVFTDSGGVQEESTVLGLPCVTLRENTERPVTVTMGTNVLVGGDPRRIIDAGRKALAVNRNSSGRPPLWDGRAGERAAACVVQRAVAER